MRLRDYPEIGQLEVPNVVGYLDSTVFYKLFLKNVLGFQTNKIKPAWHYTASGVIWRLVPTPSGKLIGESRDLQKKEVSFFCVNRKMGEVLWEEATFGEQWWIDIEAVYEDILLLHKFATPELPEHQGIIAVDVLTGTKLWQNDEVKLEAVTEKALYASRWTERGDRVVLGLDYRTGKLLESLDDMKSGLARTDPQILDVQDLEMPEPVFDLATFNSPANISIRGHCNLESLVGHVECIERPRHLIFSYYEAVSLSAKDRMNNILKILDRQSDTIVYSETICRNSATVPENFFVQEDSLFFVRERTELIAIGLQ